jgi:ribose/xylose/arabinose/galactoside ABC-type transport system permease subunit
LVGVSTGSSRGISSGRLRALRFSTEVQLLLAVAVIVLVFALLYPEQFASFTNAQNIARQGAVLLIVAIGQMFALVVGGFDISVGANMGLASTVGALVMVNEGMWPGIAAGLLASTLVGLVNGLLIARFRVSPFVATLGMLTFVTGFANHLSGGASVSGVPEEFFLYGGTDWGPVPSTAGIAAVIMLGAWVLLTRTRVGLYVYSIGGSRETCALAGVPVARYETFAYTACGFLAGVAGLVLMSRVTVGQAALGQGFELLSIATAVIGGVAIGGGQGRLLGLLLGVALLSVIRTGMNIARLSEFIQLMLTGLVLIAAVLVDRLRGARRWAFRGWMRVRRGGDRGISEAVEGADADR